jgi:hypothetical protein
MRIPVLKYVAYEVADSEVEALLGGRARRSGRSIC